MKKAKKSKKRNPKAQDVPLRYYQAHGRRISELEKKLKAACFVIDNLVGVVAKLKP